MSNRFRPSRFRRISLRDIASRAVSRVADSRRLRVLRLRSLRHRARRGSAPLSFGLRAILQRRAPLRLRSRRARLTALLAPLILLSVFIIVALRVARPSLDVQVQVRRSAIPALEKALGMPVEIGSVESDYLSRVVLRDVVVGRTEKSPIGAHFRARRVVLNLNFLGLVRGGDLLANLGSVALEAPQIWLERDRKGRTNWQHLLDGQGAASGWQGRVSISDGRVWLRDAMTRNDQGEAFRADILPLNGSLNVAPDATAFRFTSTRALVGKSRAPVSNLAFDGRFSTGTATTAAWIALGTSWKNAPLNVLADYIFSRRDIIARSGTASGTAQFSYDAARVQNNPTISGALQIENAAFVAPTVREPATNRPIEMSVVSGPLEFSNRAARTTGLGFSALGSPWKVSGSAALPLVQSNSTVLDTTFALLAESPALDAARLLAAIRPLLPKNLALESGVAQTAIRVVGTPRAWQAKGRYAAKTLAARAGGNEIWSGNASALAPEIAFAFDNRTRRVSGTFAAKTARATQNAQAVSAIAPNVRFAFDEKTARIAATLAATSLSAQIKAGNARVAVPKLAFAFDNRTQRATGNLVAASLRAAQNAQVVSAVSPDVRFAFDARQGKTAGTFAASLVDARAAIAQGRARGFQSTFAFADARGNSQIRATFSADGWNARAASGQNIAKEFANSSAQGKAARGAIFWSDRAGATNFALKMAAQNASVRAPQFGQARGALKELVVRGANRGGKMPLSIALSSENWAASGTAQRDFGVARGREAKLVASTSDANRAAWRGRAEVRGVAASEIRVAAFSPEAARALRDAEISQLGLLDARLNFAPRAGAKSANDLVFAGDLQLSRAVVAGEILRDISLRGSFDGVNMEIGEARAQSSYGAISGRVINGLASFEVPRIAVSTTLLNRALASQNLRFDGAAFGRLQVQSGAAGMRVRFALSTARGVVREASTNRPIARLENALLRGDGMLRGASINAGLVQNAALLFDGGVAVQSARVLVATDAPRVPSASRGAALRNVRARLKGQFIDLENSRFAGDVGFARAVFSIDGVRSNSSVLVAGETRAGKQTAPKISAVLADGSALVKYDARGLELARFAARAFPDLSGRNSKREDAARVRGSLAIRRSGAVAAQLLAERFDAARVQDALAPVLDFAPQLRGTAYARFNVGGTLTAPRVALDARVLNGALVLPTRTLPFDTTRASFVFTEGAVEVRDATIWSRGARVAFEGKATTITFGEEEADDYALDIKVRADALRLRDAVAVFSAAPSDLDGLASGEFHIGGTLALPRIDGDAKLALATVWGIPLDEGKARVRFQMTADGPRFAIDDIVARSGAARLAGRFIADAPADQWRFALATSDVDTSRALRGAARTDPNNPLRNAPLRGTLSADIDVRGRFGENLALVPLEGGAQIKAAALRWRGRDVGTLDADVSLDGKRVRFNQITLRDEDNPNSPTLQIAGSVPLDADDQSIAISVEARRAPLELLRVALEETQRAVSENGVPIPVLGTVLRGWNDLPRKLAGEATLDAKISGSLAVPVAEIAASVREAKLGDRKLPDLQTALHLEDGALAVRLFELKQTANGETASDEDEPRETVLRIADGGRISPTQISLDGELLGADLKQLAPWVSALRDETGTPVLGGEVALFNFQVRGAPDSPRVTGSLEAQNLVLRNYTLDRLRLARFEIDKGKFSVAPGNLTVVKGGFQSSAAWGSVPWNWTSGVAEDSALEIHVPVQTADFGALAGAFVPALREAGARKFEGNIDIGGTLEEPQFTGEIAMAQVRFATATLSGVDVGVRALNGTLRFGAGNVFVFDNVEGELARASQIDATQTGNRPASEKPLKLVDASLQAAGKFKLNGTIALRLNPEVFASPARFVAAQRYDLAFNLEKAEFARADFSGIRDLTLDATFKTGAGAEEIAQRVSWQFSGAGREMRAKNKTDAAGSVRSAGTATLDFEDIAKSRWDGTMVLRAFAFDAPNLARGKIDGDLKFGALPVARAETLLARTSLEQRLKINRSAQRAGETSIRPLSEGHPDFDRTPLKVQTRSAAQNLGDETPKEQKFVPGISGSFALTETQITGAPVGTVGVARLLPEFPAFDIRFLVGRDVRFISPTLRADFAGGLQISGTPRDPNITGTLLARDGQIRFPGASARITTAEVDVAVARDKASGLVRSSAIIDATARGQAGKYTITLHVRGPLDFGSNNAQELRIDVISNPPLSQDEAFARLTGTSLRDLQERGAASSETNQAYASAFLSVVSAPLFSGIERSLADAFGLSNITLDYRLNEPISVQFGKAVGDRVYVSYKRSLSGMRPGEPVAYQFRVDYRIKGDFLLGIQTDERNQRQITLERTFRF